MRLGARVIVAEAGGLRVMGDVELELCGRFERFSGIEFLRRLAHAVRVLGCENTRLTCMLGGRSVSVYYFCT